MSRFAFFLSEAWELQRRNRAGAFASMTALTAVLFLLAVVLMAGHNVGGAARQLESRKGLEVFLMPDTSTERVQEIAAAFRSFGEVADVVFISQDAALREIEGDLGGADIVGAMGENPLLPSLRVSLTPQAVSRTGVLQDLAREMETYQGVEEVVYGSSWIEGLESGLANVRIATTASGALASAAVLLVLWNTVKLAFLGRRDAIRILKIVGATSGFIRAPYLLLGTMHAVSAACLALALSAALRLSVSPMMPGISFLPPLWIAFFLGGAIVLGLASSFASVEPALRNVERSREAVTR
jgi:cell division transport system permease protein